MKFGYACINTELRKENIFTGRTIRQATFDKIGLDGLAHIYRANLKDLIKILNWNVYNGIYFYRISSNLLPWFDKYYKQIINHEVYEDIINYLWVAGNIIKKYNIRVTMHPGHFTKLASKNSKVVANAINNLHMHGEIMDLLDCSRTPYNKINIHIGCGASDKVNTAKRFINNLQYLPYSAKKRLTIENDDRHNLWTSSELFDLILDKTGIPLVYDDHHNNCAPDKFSFSIIYKLYVKPLWKDITPVVHFSSSRRMFEDLNANRVAHADDIHDFDWSYWNSFDVDIMFESKNKEQSVLSILENLRLLKDNTNKIGNKINEIY